MSIGSDGEEGFTLFDSEEDFKLKYGSDSDSDTETIEEEPDQVEELMGFITAADLLCNEDITNIEKRTAKKENAIKCSIDDYYYMKSNCIQFHSKEILNKGYYSGHLSLARCQYCSKIIDAWPCKDLLLYDIPKTHCPYCNFNMKTATNLEFHMYKKSLPKRDTWTLYLIK